MRRLLSSLLVAVLTAGFAPPARGQDAPRVYDATEAAPKKSAALVWRYDSTNATGYWYADAQIIKIDQRLRGCEDALAVELFDRKVEEAKGKIPSWVWVSIGVLVGAGGAWAVHAGVSK